MRCGKITKSKCKWRVPANVAIGLTFPFADKSDEPRNGMANVVMICPKCGASIASDVVLDVITSDGVLTNSSALPGGLASLVEA